MSNPWSFACTAGGQYYINTVASLEGYGGYTSCRVGEVRIGGAVTPAFGLGASTSAFDAHLLSGGNSSTPGTSTPITSTSFLAGLARQEDRYTKDENGVYLRRIIDRNTALFGGGWSSSSDANVSWNIFETRNETAKGFDILKLKNTDGQYTITAGASFIKESVINFNKPSDTLRDDALRLSAMLWLEVGWQKILPEKAQNYELESKALSLSHIYYMYADAMNGISTILDYFSINRDVANVTGFFGASSDDPFIKTDLSQKNHLLAISSIFNAPSLAAQRRQFFHLANVQTSLLVYHGVRSLAMSIAAYNLKDNTDHHQLATPAISSLRTMADMIVLKNTDTPKETLAWQLGISAALLLGALTGRDNEIAQATAQAGMEGLLTTTLDPNARQDKNFTVSEEYFSRFSSHSRSLNNHHESDKRVTLGKRTTLSGERIYTETSTSSPYPTGDGGAPATTDAAIGLQAISGKASSVVRVRASVDIGARSEFSGAGIEIGARAKAGVDLVFKPSESIRFNLGATCSGTIYATGHDTECGIGAGISF